MFEMPLSHISTSGRFFSRLSSTIFFKDLDISDDEKEEDCLTLAVTHPRGKKERQANTSKVTQHLRNTKLTVDKYGLENIF